MEYFQGSPLDDLKNGHDFLLLRPGNFSAVQVVVQHPVIQPNRPSSPYTPLRAVPGEQAESRNMLGPQLD